MVVSAEVEERLIALTRLLINQERAEVIVPPYAAAPGYWFGGGNLVEAEDGRLILVGRYRNQGDSRTGLAAGERGLELAIFESAGLGSPFVKRFHHGKEDLSSEERQVLSIEGAALRRVPAGWELYVSSEKTGIGYPPGLESHLKPGAGVWTIDRLQAPSLDELQDADMGTILESADPEHLHFKDPFLHEDRGGNLWLFFCTHPFCWSSSNTALGLVAPGSVAPDSVETGFFPRGTTWDVAITRGTSVLKVPQLGCCRDLEISLMFYDGGECLRNLDEHAQAVRRPRGYSCEELGGVAYFLDEDLAGMTRLSRYEPFFISPHGTGCSRYVDVLTTEAGLIATWQQAQEDGSQPLVMNAVSRDEIESILS